MEKARQVLNAARKMKDRPNGRILVFTGARQVGKTTLVKRGLKEYAYLSIEDPVTRPDFARLTAAQWHSLYPRAALDEIQKEPSLIESIKATYDQFEDTRYVLLGSSQLLLMQQVRESLAGRCTIFDLFPLTLPELGTASLNDEIPPSAWQTLLENPKELPELSPSFSLDPRMAEKDRAWRHYLRFGGYPALVADGLDDDDRFSWLSNYVRTYLERDVRDLASFRDLEPFVKLQQAVALQTAALFNASALAARLGITSKTVQRYLSYLEMSYQTLTLPAWERNKEKRLSKAPKVHYLDNGVLQAVLRKRGGMTGGEFESLVIAELYKQAKNISAEASFHHLRTHDGKEVDLLVELQDGYVAFEIKMAERVIPADARHLMNLGGFLDKPLLQGFVLSNDPETKRLGDGITALHAAAFLG